jgi:hypothetical protein
MKLLRVAGKGVDRLTTWIAAFGFAFIMPSDMVSAQQAPKHLNPVIEKLAAGKPFFGVQSGDLSLENARALARAEIDYVYLDMEHGPMDFEGLHRFTVGMIDKATIQKKGNLQPNVAVFARFAPTGANKRSGSSSRRSISG